MAFAAMGAAGVRTFRRDDLDDYAGWPPRKQRTREDGSQGGSVLSRTAQLLRGVLRSSAGAADRGLNPEFEGR